MAEFQKVIQALRRMCYGRLCGKCPLHEASGGANCNIWIKENSLEAERIIMRWAAEHPIKTNGMKFREVFGVDCTEPILCDFDGWLEQEYKGTE